MGGGLVPGRFRQTLRLSVTHPLAGPKGLLWLYILQASTMTGSDSDYLSLAFR